MDECKRSGQIPPFGNWDYANDLPITQYFESARQAGLLRFSSSSGECDLHVANSGDLYAVDFNRPHLPPAFPPPKKRGSNYKRCPPHVKEQMTRNQQQTLEKVCDVTDPPRKQLFLSQKHKQKQKHLPKHNNNSNIKAVRQQPSAIKAVDEDLYKIPSDLLHSSKRKKMLGFLSRCLVPACTV